MFMVVMLVTRPMDLVVLRMERVLPMAHVKTTAHVDSMVIAMVMRTVIKMVPVIPMQIAVLIRTVLMDNLQVMVEEMAVEELQEIRMKNMRLADKT